MAKVIYNDNSISESEDVNDTSGLTWNKSIIAKLGIEYSASWFRLWGNLENGSHSAYYRSFGRSRTWWGVEGRYNSRLRVVCVAD